MTQIHPKKSVIVFDFDKTLCWGSPGTSTKLAPHASFQPHTRDMLMALKKWDIAFQLHLMDINM